jgi:hypothetical protein
MRRKWQVWLGVYYRTVCEEITRGRNVREEEEKERVQTTMNANFMLPYHAMPRQTEVTERDP